MHACVQGGGDAISIDFFFFLIVSNHIVSSTDLIFSIIL